jgi:hypothetical protein
MKKGKSNLNVITKFCHVDEKCCPQLCLDKGAKKKKKIVIIDDFGGKVHMSKAQLQAFIEKAKNGDITF